METENIIDLEKYSVVDCRTKISFVPPNTAKILYLKKIT